MSTTESGRQRSQHLRPAWFTAYKGCNALFTGLSVGAIFTIYAPLDPALFSAGGIGLAVGMLLIATQYERLLAARWFFGISLLVEVLMVAAIGVILVWQIGELSALAVYAGYQLTFVFGSYLVRCETLLVAEDIWLKRLDISKQTGYLLGMGGAWLFYLGLESYAGIEDKEQQVVGLHNLLLLIELLVIGLLWRSFDWRSPSEPVES